MFVGLRAILRDHLLTIIGGALVNGRLDLYNGVIGGGTLQCSIQLTEAPYIAEGELILPGGEIGVRTASGLITWGQFVDENGDPVLDVDAGASGATLTIAEPEGMIGGTVTLNPSVISIS